MHDTIFAQKDWESDIRDVKIEVCAADEDPMGYRAVFYLSDEAPAMPVAFRIGASLLAQRARSLAMAGYKAPMTKKALALIEGQVKAAAVA